MSGETNQTAETAATPGTAGTINTGANAGTAETTETIGTKEKKGTTETSGTYMNPFITRDAPAHVNAPVPPKKSNVLKIVLSVMVIGIAIAIITATVLLLVEEDEKKPVTTTGTNHSSSTEENILTKTTTVSADTDSPTIKTTTTTTKLPPEDLVFETNFKVVNDSTYFNTTYEKYRMQELRKNMDVSQDKCGKFYEHICHKFSTRGKETTTKIFGKKSDYFTLTRAKLIDILATNFHVSNSTHPDYQVTKLLFESCIEARKQEPNYAKITEVITNIKNKASLAVAIGEALSKGFEIFLRVREVHTDLEFGDNPAKGYLLIEPIVQVKDITEPDDVDDYHKKLSKFTNEAITKIDYSDLTNFEQKMYDITKEDVFKEPPQVFGSPAEFVEYLNASGWDVVLKMAAGPKNVYESIVLKRPQYLKKLAEYIKEQPKDTTKLYVIKQIMKQTCHSLGGKCRNLFWEKFDKNPSGYISRDARQCILTLEPFVGHAYADVYSSMYQQDNSTELKIFSTKIIQNFKGILVNETFFPWHGNSTKNKSVAKATALVNRIILPNVRKKGQGDELINKLKPFPGSSFYEHLLHIREMMHKYKFLDENNTEAEYRQMYQKRAKLWPVSPLSAKPIYLPEENRLYLPLLFTKGAFFKNGTKAYMAYAETGYLIARELVHMADLVGSAFNGTGAPEDQWSEDSEAKEKYQVKMNSMKEQIGSTGATLLEDAADQIGLLASYEYLWKLNSFFFVNGAIADEIVFRTHFGHEQFQNVSIGSNILFFMLHASQNCAAYDDIKAYHDFGDLISPAKKRVGKNLNVINDFRVVCNSAP